MNHNRNLINAVQELVNNMAKFSQDHFTLEWDDIFSDDQASLTALCIEDDGRELVSIYENDADLATPLVNYFKTSEESYLRDFGYNITNYYKPRLIKMIEEACKVRYTEFMMESGHEAHTRSDNGEIYWVKR